MLCPEPTRSAAAGGHMHQARTGTPAGFGTRSEEALVVFFVFFWQGGGPIPNKTFGGHGFCDFQVRDFLENQRICGGFIPLSIGTRRVPVKEADLVVGISNTPEHWLKLHTVCIKADTAPFSSSNEVPRADRVPAGAVPVRAVPGGGPRLSVRKRGYSPPGGGSPGSGTRRKDLFDARFGCRCTPTPLFCKEWPEPWK